MMYYLKREYINFKGYLSHWISDEITKEGRTYRGEISPANDIHAGRSTQFDPIKVRDRS